MHDGPNVPLTRGSSLLRLFDSSISLTIFASDTETSFTYVTAAATAGRLRLARESGQRRRGDRRCGRRRGTWAHHYRTTTSPTCVTGWSRGGHKKARGRPRPAPCSISGRQAPARQPVSRRNLLLRVATAELVHATADVQGLLLAGVERVRMAG